MKTKDLLNIVKKANKLIPAVNPTIPILENILITDNQLIASDLFTWIIKKNVPIDGTFLLPAKQLGKILAKLDKESDLQFSIENKYCDSTMKKENYSVITVEGRKFSLLSDPVDDFPITPKYTEKTGYIEAEDVVTMQSLVKFTSNDQLRPAMCGLEVGEQIAATNGHVLAWRTLMGRTGLAESVIVRSEVPKYLDNIRYSFGLNPEKDFENIVFENDEEIIITRNIDETYPSWKSVIPEPKHRKITAIAFDTKPLIKSLELADLCANPTTHQCRLSFDTDKGKTNIHSEDLDFGREYDDSVDIEVKAKETFEIGFNIQFLLMALKDAEGTVVMDFFEPNRPVIMTDDNKTKFLIMPVMPRR